MNKQTAIQLLRESIDSEVKLGTKMVINWDAYLEMEREQLEKAYKKGCMDEIDKRIESCVEESCKTDYNETYKGGEQ
jgi:hypothetical protein